MRGVDKQGGDSRIKDTTTVALGQPGDGGPRLPKETSGGGGKGTGGKPGKGGPKLPKEGLA